jgi:hypothetical protein
LYQPAVCVDVRFVRVKAVSGISTSNEKSKVIDDDLAMVMSRYREPERRHHLKIGPVFGSENFVQSCIIDSYASGQHKAPGVTV